MKKLIPFLTLAVLLAVPSAFTHAQPVIPDPSNTQLGTSTGGVIAFICVLFNYAFFGLLLAAVGFVLLAAYRYLTAAGDPGKVSAANKTLIFAAVAIAVALFARAIPVIVGNFVLRDSSGGSFDVCNPSNAPTT